MEVSVIIPCHNAAALLPAMLDSLAADRPDVGWEVIVVDDRSTDATARIAEERTDLPVRVVRTSGSGGPGAARNVGAAHAHGDLLLFLDHDDQVEAGYLAAMTDALRDADVVAGSLDVRLLNPRWVVESRPDSVVDGLFDHFDFLPYAPSCAMGIRRSVFEAVGGFATGDGEDVDLSWRAQLQGYRIAHAPGAVLHYRYRSSFIGLVRQAITYGAAQPLLYRRFRGAGMPGRTAADVRAAWFGLLRETLHARSWAELTSIAYLAGVYLGRIRGSLRSRVLYL
jgi:glycosyltransferase involved in cell wall biosynthesis